MNADTLSVLLGNGDGTLRAQTVLSAGVIGPFGLGMGDYNKDGLPDLAVTGNFNNKISILLGDLTETATATGVIVYGTGTHNVLASYPGDAAHSASQSATTALAGSTTFSITTPTTAVPVAQGASATVSIGVVPVGGAFNGVVTMSASGLPTGATALFVPPTVTPGATTATTMLTIQLVPATMAKLTGDHSGAQLASFNLAALGLCGLLFFGKRSSKAVLIVLISFGLAGATMLAGCGNTNHDSTRPGNYTITVTGTSGTFHASNTFTLTVQP